MSSTTIRLDEKSAHFATLGGSILGGGGGGSAITGKKSATLATQYGELCLTDLNDLPEDAVIVTASMVGAPAAKEKFVSPADMVRGFELFTQSTGLKIGGIITNENGGGSTVNGWVAASVLGIPLIDAECNGRAHPTGVMGSLNLHRDPTYVTTMAAVGGRRELGRRVECVFTGSITHCSKLVRAAAVEAGGLVSVARNPVTAAYVKKNGAIGGVSHAIRTGEIYAKGLERSVETGIGAVTEFLGGTILAQGPVTDYKLLSAGGFDVGSVKVSGYEMTFWNEYMTVDAPDGSRLGTFPDLIMTFDTATGRPMPTSDLVEGQNVCLICTNWRNLSLAATMFDKELLAEVEGIIHRPMLPHLDF